jgi:predicted RNase H-like nuclease (RuvC/YqgF family)
MEDLGWVILCLLLCAGAFLYGRNSAAQTSVLKPAKKNLKDEEMDDLTLYPDDSRDSKSRLESLEREKASNKKIIEEYEQEITYLKAQLLSGQKNLDSRIVINI